MRRIPFVVALLVIGLLPVAALAVPESASAQELGQRCENDRDGYAVSYPDGWHTNERVDELDVEPCSFFGPEPVQVVLSRDVGPTGGVISLLLLHGCVGDIGQPIVSERLEIADLPTTRMEARGRSGLRVYSYLVSLHVADSAGGQDGDEAACQENVTLFAATRSDSGGSYRENKDVLDEMMRSLDITSGFLAGADIGVIASVAAGLLLLTVVVHAITFSGRAAPEATPEATDARVGASGSAEARG